VEKIKNCWTNCSAKGMVFVKFDRIQTNKIKSNIKNQLGLNKNNPGKINNSCFTSPASCKAEQIKGTERK
jgi:hypothetical protein